MATPEESDASQLKRILNLPLLTLYGLGTTIGAGIYALIGEIAGVAGYGAPLAFLIAALVAGLTACSFAELAARLPRGRAPRCTSRRASAASASRGWSGSWSRSRVSSRPPRW